MESTDLNSPVKSSIIVKQIATVPADVCSCVSLGAKCFKIASDPRSGNENNETQDVFLLVFEVSFKMHGFTFCKLAIDEAELTVELSNNYIAADAAPKLERHLKSVRVYYTYGVRKENANKYNYNLSYKLGDSTSLKSSADSSSSRSESYESVYETEATIEYCTVQYQNPLSSVPKWVFERSQNQRVLRDTRAVWFTIEKIESDLPVAGRATLSAEFKLVYENG